MRLIFLLTSFFFGSLAPAEPSIELIKGLDVVSGLTVSAPRAPTRGWVVVFLSAVCPCSNSHIQELSSLAKAYPDFFFVGVHSNANESAQQTSLYFKKAQLPFSVIQDEGTKIADAFKALKTPHVFILKINGETAYQGGVSSSQNFEKAEHQFLREALEDLMQNKRVRTPEGRTLGCMISRGEKNVW